MPRDNEMSQHDKAEQDYWDKNFDPPRDPISAPFWSKEDVEDWNNYNDGWKNAESQDDE